MTGSADPRGAELLEIGRMLTELDVELPARSGPGPPGSRCSTARAGGRRRWPRSSGTSGRWA
ncbi:hypothetical protein ACFQ0B_00025 [Nonomuraea thailandensis]